MKWIIIDEDYLNYLRKIENRIPYSNYGKDKFKPFFGELFTVGELTYVSQISHKQPRHESLKNSLDFYKIFIPDTKNIGKDRFVAVVNLNYMFPIKRSMIHYLDFSKIDECRSFINNTEKSQYIDLLQKEMLAINKLDLPNKANKLYELKKNYPEDRISSRCLNFLELEKYAKAYIFNK